MATRTSQRYSFAVGLDEPAGDGGDGFKSSLMEGLGQGIEKRKSVNKRKSVTRSASSRIRVDRDIERGVLRSMSDYSTPSKSTYIRPEGPDLVSSKHPSCSGLPSTWNNIHDRFIAYLATHAPLERNGCIPRYEEKRERWRSEDILRLLAERFPELGGCFIKISNIENRLVLLDQAGDNDYFQKQYGAYRLEKWGRNI